MRTLILVLACGLSTATPVGAQSSVPQAGIDSVFRRFDRVARPGCAVGVMRNGDLAYARGYGMANLDLGIAITPQSVFRTGSLSKQFTAASIVLLAMGGAISLDAEVREYIPELPAYARPMTVRQLVNHTSGVRDYLTLMTLAGKRDDDFYTNEEVLQMIVRQREPNFLPGDAFLYSNSGYFLLSEIVGRVSGTSLRRFANDRLFEPLGMRHTHFHDDHTEVVPGRAAGYAQADDGTWHVNMTTLDMVGDGGVFTSIEDLVFWERQLLDQRIGGAEWLSEMLRPGRLTSGEVLDYAAGLRVDTYRGLRTVEHGGAFVGFRAFGLRFPEERVAVYVLCNFAQALPGQYAHSVADLVLADRFSGAPPSATAGREPAAEPVSVAMAASRRRQITGSFSSPELDVLYTVSADREQLHLAVGPRTWDLRVVNDTTMTAAGGFVTIRLPAGAVDRFLLDAGRVKNLQFERR